MRITKALNKVKAKLNPVDPGSTVKYKGTKSVVKPKAKKVANPQSRPLASSGFQVPSPGKRKGSKKNV